MITPSDRPPSVGELCASSPPASGSPAFRFGMGLLGEDQPDPDGSSGSQAIKSVGDHLGGLRVHAPDLSELGSHSLELSEAGNLRSLQRFPG